MSRIAKAAAVALGTGTVVVSGAGMAMAHGGAQGVAAGSPGVGSGNVVQAPVHAPINVCGNTVSVSGLLNPAFGNTCANVDGDGHGKNGGGDKNGGDDKSGGHHSGDNGYGS